MLENLVYWHWMVLGLVLVILEMLAPGAILMWFGFGAIIVGGLLFLFPEMGWEWQVLIFSLISFASIFAWKKLRKSSPDDDTESGTLNQRGKALVGRKVPLKEAIVNGVGRIQIDDTFWRVEGDDMEEGRLVRITDTDGATLKVEPSE
ncbi:NfeD family protein [Aliikangiella sp. G2MR2-5]|uniref:NfeD family protein n=1 Tax=Aliikangiella sp. G2MR2-5 TaxID=2788943 RepID=UPI0018AC6121|nr:NfeD family protein [Aliikangiella sp. G2MR2-5]